MSTQSGAKDTVQRESLPGEPGRDTALIGSTTAAVGRAIFLVLSMDGRIADVSPHIEELVGYARSDVIGRDWFDTFIPPDQRDALRSLFVEAISGESVQTQVYDVLTKDGRRRSVEWHSDLVCDEAGVPYAVSAIGHDVTERVAREREMRENDKRLRLALRAADLGTWELDLTSGAICNSRLTSELLGFSPATTTSSLAEWALKVHPDDAVHLSGFATRIPSDHNDLRRIRVRVATDDGAVRTVLLRGSVEYDAAGRPQRAFGIAADHSKQVKAELQLREKQAELAGILANASDLILRLDLHGIIEFANRSAEEFLGIGEGASRARSMLDLIDDADAEGARERFAKLAATACETSGEVHMRSQAGMRLVEWHCRTVVDEAGRPIGVTAVGRDVTAVRAFEEQLWHSSQQLEVEVAQRTAALREANAELQREILDRKDVEEQLRSSQTALLVAERLAGIGRWDMDLVSGTTTWGELVYQIYGLKPEETAVEHDTWLQLTHPDDRVRMVDWSKQVALGDDESPVSYRVIRPDGETRLVQCMARALRDEAGRPLRVIGTVQDITERHRTESQQREVDKLTATGRMAARIAHEINNPLAGIKNAFQLVKPAVPADFQHYHFVARIEKEIERISGIVRQMFDLYRPVVSHEARADLREIIGDICELLGPSAGESEIRITDALMADATLVAAPESLIRPVLFNILQNAVEASPRGATVAVRSIDRGDTIELTVADQGSGIPDSLRTKVFEPFFTTKSGLSTGGLGLGLAIAKNTVEALGGTLDFAARPEGGTAFRIVLPRARSSSTEVKS